MSGLRQQSLTPWLSLEARGHMQLAENDLPGWDLFPLGGPDSVRGYAFGERVADSGYSLQFTLLADMPQIANVPITWQLGPFCDTGEVYSKTPAPGFSDSENIWSVGLELRAAMGANFQVTGNIAWAQKQISPETDHSPTAYINGELRF